MKEQKIRHFFGSAFLNADFCGIVNGNQKNIWEKGCKG